MLARDDLGVGPDHVVFDVGCFDLQEQCEMEEDGTYLEKNGTLALVDDLDPRNSLLVVELDLALFVPWAVLELEFNLIWRV